MPSRRLPQTDDQRSNALTSCSTKALATPPANWLITTAQNNTLQGTLSPWRNARNAAAQALQEQAAATALCDQCLIRTARIVSHFIQVLNLAIERGVLQPAVRAGYKLAVSNLDVPDINTVPDALLWAANIADGEAARVAEGGTPLAWPSAAEVAAESSDLAFNRSQQTTAKTFYDQLQEAIAAQRPAVDALIRDLWDTIEYNLRNEPTQSSLRRKAREWGVVYDGEEPEEETPEPTPPNP